MRGSRVRVPFLAFKTKEKEVSRETWDFFFRYLHGRHKSGRNVSISILREGNE